MSEPFGAFESVRDRRLHRVLLAACGLYALVGAALAIFSSEAFGPWRGQIAEALYGTAALDPSVARFARFTDGILGASICGKWVASAWIVHVPLRRGERWAAWAVLASHLTWFVIDSTTSVLRGAAINVLVINLAPLVVVGGLTLALLPRANRARAPSSPPRVADRALYAACAISALVGLAAAIAFDAPLFAVYRDAIADLYFGGVEGDWLVYARFVFGLIGGTIAGHFVALGASVAFAPRARWVRLSAVSSMLAWFVLDASISALEGAWFNVLWVDVPSLAVVLVPATIALRGADRP
ncbi:MAG: hypothetical protein AB7S26_03310 [Sandaracinaceae bacterium]